MAALSPREYRRLKKEAAAFARRVRAGRTYYVVVKHPAPAGRGAPQRLLSEIEFTKRALVGLMHGSFSPEGAYIHLGPIYEDRSHRDIRGLLTIREQARADAEFERTLFASPHWRKELDNVASGTGGFLRKDT